MKVITNHHWREIEYKIPEWNEEDEEPEFEACFEYKGDTYFLSEFIRLNGNLELGTLLDEWEGIQHDTAFSGTLVKLHEDGDAIIAGWYYS